MREGRFTLLIHLALIAIVGVLAYANSFHVPFVFDDQTSIVENPVIKDLNNFFGTSAGYQFNPRRFLGYLSFALNYRFAGLNVVGYHVVNLVVHISTALLVYALVRLTMRTPYFFEAETESLPVATSVAAQWIALLSALLFIAHPVQTQAVTYIVQRLASLATLFYLLALVSYLQARLVLEEGRSVGRSIPWYGVAVLAALCAMKTKEIAFTLPLAAVLCEISFFHGGLKKRFLSLLPLLLTLPVIPSGIAGGGGGAVPLLADVSEKLVVTREISRWDYLLTQLNVIVTYIRLLFLPVSQNLDYDYPLSHSLHEPRTMVSLLVLLLLSGGGVYLYRRSGLVAKESTHSHSFTSDRPRSKAVLLRLPAFGIIWFFLTLMVESSLIPIADVIFEHRLYLPSVGACIAVAAAAWLACGERRPLFATVGLAVAGVLAVATWKRNEVWEDTVSLWRDVATKSPEKGRPHNNLGRALTDRNRIDEALAEYFEAVRFDPYLPQAHSNLGADLVKKGRTDEAIRHLTIALNLTPDNAIAHYNLGVALDHKGLLAAAVEQYRAVEVLMPDNAEAHNNLGIDYGLLAMPDRAMDELRQAIRLKPDFADAYYNLGLVYRRTGKLAEAIENYQAAVRLAPEHADAHNNLGSAYWSMDDVDRALEQFEVAVRLKPEEADFRNNLARARERKFTGK